MVANTEPSMKNAADKIFDALPQLRKSLASLTKQDVYVGVPSDNKERRDESSGMNNATIGYIMENGSPAANIPARPFLAPGIKAIRPEIVKLQRLAAKVALAGKTGEVERIMNILGLKAVSSVRAAIVNGDFAPLAPRTLAARKRRGITRTTPLIDTGKLLASISYVIRKRKV